MYPIDDLELEDLAIEEQIFVEPRVALDLAVVHEELVEEPHANGQMTGCSVLQRRLEVILVGLGRVNSARNLQSYHRLASLNEPPIPPEMSLLTRVSLCN